MREEIIKPAFEIFICPNIHGASPNPGEKVVEGFAPCKTFDECADKTYGVGNVLLLGGVVDKTFEGGGSVDFGSSVDGFVEPFGDGVEEGNHCVVVAFVILGTVTDLQRTISI
jgi:hypothetical protein